MKRLIDDTTRPLLLAACTLLAGACTPAAVDLGVYDDDVKQHDEDAGQDAGGESSYDARVPVVSSDDADVPPNTDEDAAMPVPPPDDSPEDACDEPRPADDAVEAPGCAACGCFAQGPVEIPDEHCFDVRAHAADDDAAGYPLPEATEQYVRFTVHAPSRDAHYIRSVQPIIDASHVLHHVTVSERNANEGGDDALPGGVSVAKTKMSWRRVVYSWSPGLSGLHLDPTVGIPVEAAASYTLEIHYSGSDRPLSAVAEKDSSGVRICTTSTPPRFPVSLTRLGTDFAWMGPKVTSGTEATANCASASDFPIYLLALMPQVDVPGRDMKLVLDRADGKSQELLYDSLLGLDAPQAGPVARLELRDMVTTTCHYSEPVVFGSRVEDESCEMYALQWPAYALRYGTSLVEGGIGSCPQ